jgi:hypothetical protein
MSIFYRSLLMITLAAYPVCAQDATTDEIVVNLPVAALAGEQLLPAGEYRIRQVPSANNSRILQFIKRDEQTVLASVAALPALNNSGADATVLELSQAEGRQYVRRIWIEGKSYGYELPAPNQYSSPTASTSLTAAFRPNRSTARDTTSAAAAQSPASPPTATSQTPSSSTDLTSTQSQQSSQAPEAQAAPAPQAPHLPDSRTAPAKPSDQPSTSSQQAQTRTTEPQQPVTQAQQQPSPTPGQARQEPTTPPQSTLAQAQTATPNMPETADPAIASMFLGGVALLLLALFITPAAKS